MDAIVQAGWLPEADLQGGLLQLEGKDYLKTRKAADELLRKYPAKLQAATLMAQAYAAVNQISAAVERLRKLAQENPRSAPLQDLLGKWQLRANDQSAARQSFEAARKLDPHFLPPTL